MNISITPIYKEHGFGIIFPHNSHVILEALRRTTVEPQPQCLGHESMHVVPLYNVLTGMLKELHPKTRLRLHHPVELKTQTTHARYIMTSWDSCEVRFKISCLWFILVHEVTVSWRCCMLVRHAFFAAVF